MNRLLLVAMMVLTVFSVGAGTYHHRHTANGAGQNVTTPDNWNSWTDNKTDPAPKPDVKPDVKPPQPTPEPKPDNKVLPVPKTYAEALAYAKAKNKKLFLFCKTDYCGACKLMDRDTLSNAKVTQALKDAGVCMIYYLNPDLEPEVGKQYKVTAVPVYYIIDGDEKQYKAGLGMKDVNQFLAWLKS